jgi:hypothetical protein
LSKNFKSFKERYANNEYDFDERNKKLSIAISKKYVEGGFCWSEGHYKPIKCDREICAYRSSWELEFMQLLDSAERVKSWQYEPFFIRYDFENKSRRYIPDFIVVSVSNKSYMFEVKPKCLQESQKNIAKQQAAVDYCLKNNLEFSFWSRGDEFVI